MVAQLVEASWDKLEGREFNSPMVTMEFFTDIIFPAALWPLREMNTRNISWQLVHRADNLTTFMY